MKRILIASAVSAIAMSAASAADIYTPDGLKDTFTEDRNTTYFQGLGVGVDVGGEFTSIAVTDGPFEFDGVSADGLVGGIHLDYLVALDPEQLTRFGIYSEGGFSNVDTTFSPAPGEIDVLNQGHYYGLGLKAGVVVYDKTLLFARFGYEWSQWNFLENTDVDVGSWAVGGGIDTMVSEEWSLGLEGTYLFVDSVDVDGIGDVTPYFEESEAGRIKARLTRRF
jgi:opacity protein-like surface antigen